MSLVVALTGAVVVLASVSGALAWAWHRERARHRAVLAEHEGLRQLVESRVERPNVFGHEVRTPLALINGAAELLAEETPGPLTDTQREFVHTIASNARQVIAMAEDLLVEAQVNAHLFELRPERLDLRALIRQTVRETRRINTVPIRLSNAGPPLWLDADPDLLRQALWNLVNNAVRHAGSDVHVTIEVTAGEGEAVVLVSDDGAGLSASDREHLFQPYVVGTSRKPGTGLGMMVTQQIITQHGGRILVDSVAGAGTTFFCTLPLRQEGRRG